MGGLSLGEPKNITYRLLSLQTAILPRERARYLMGVGTPADLVEAIARGIDMFDCVLPTRIARNGSNPGGRAPVFAAQIASKSVVLPKNGFARFGGTASSRSPRAASPK